MEMRQNLQQHQLTSYELLLSCQDKEMPKIAALVKKIANGHSILILGESGTGKEVVANAIREQSNRATGPFSVLDCANLDGDTLKSHLFGHEMGSFTGATDRRIGAIERAHNGTLFLDEIGEIPFAQQARLLRVFQEGTFNRLGGDVQIKSNFRLIAATNKNLPRMVREGTFREDLYFRLQTFTINVPPLRERMDDVVRLANHFVDKMSGTKKLMAAAEKALLQHCWPGNVRELKSIIERGVVFSGDNEFITEEDLALTNPLEFRPNLTTANKELVLTQTMENMIEAIQKTYPGQPILDYVERHTIEALLRLNKGNKSQTSLQLGIDPATLYRKRKLWGMENQAL